MPLSDVVLTDRWPDESTAPAPPPSRLRAPDQPAVVGARDQADRLLSPPASLGVLDRAVDRAVALGRGNVRGGVLVLAAADHPVTAHRISAYDRTVTRQVASAAAAGAALGVVAAAAAGLRWHLVDAGIAGDPLADAIALRPEGARGDLVTSPAMTPGDTARLVDGGRRLGQQLAEAGVVALGEIGVGNTTVAAALACGLLDADPAEVTGLGAGSDSAMVDRKREVVAAAVLRARRSTPGLTGDPMAALAELGGPELAVLTGVTLGAAQAHAVVVLDGFATALAALAAVQLEPGAQACLVAGQRSRESGHALALTSLGLEPLLDLRMRAGEGVGAALATGLLLDALRLRRETARVRY